MVSVLQRAFACFSCQGVNSLEAAAKQRKADSRLNLRRPQPPPLFSQFKPGADQYLSFQCSPDITQDMMLLHNRLLISRFGVAFKFRFVNIIGVYIVSFEVSINQADISLSHLESFINFGSLRC